MSVTCREPTATGVFFDYPTDATGSVAPYWLASATGSMVRMTGACKRAFLATIEAIVERAVAIANIGSSAVGVALKTSTFAPGTAPFSSVDLDAWSTGTGRAALAAKFVRGCPFDEWGSIVLVAWRLWSGTTRTISFVGSVVTLYSWQAEMLDVDTEGFVEDGENGDDILCPQIYDMATTPSDDGMRDYATPTHAPWNTWHGLQENPSCVGNWLVTQLANLGRVRYYPAFPGIPRETMATDMLDSAPRHPLALLADGHIGNWITVSGGTAAATSPRRSGAAWAVFQAMLANMRYTHLGFNWSADFHYTEEQREVRRVVTFNASDNTFAITDAGVYDSVVRDGVSSTLHSSSSCNEAFSACGVEFSLGIPDADAEQFVVATRPWEGFVEFDPRDYMLTLTDYAYGTGSVFFDHDVTDGVRNAVADVPGEYPAHQFASYLDERGGVTFVDRCEVPDPDVAMGSIVSHSVRGEAGSANLSVPVAAHCQWLIDQLATPRAYPTPSPVNNAAVQSAANAWWRGWKLHYPSSPNWPAVNPTKYFPDRVEASGNPGQQRPLRHDDSQGAWAASSVGGYFGSFELAFPDYPYGWDNQDYMQITPGFEALAAYSWQFKAMPHT